MTGFARAEGRHGDYGWVWEIRSVNSRGLDIRCRLPSGMDALEAGVREAIGARLKRGAVSVNLQTERGKGGTHIAINDEALEQVLGLWERYRGRVDAAAPRLDALLSVRGVVELVEPEESEEEMAARDAAIRESFTEALDGLCRTRDGEGVQLHEMLAGHIGRIAELADEARASAANQPEALRARLAKQVAELLEAQPALPEERLAQEAALLASKADVREELDRLGAHVETATGLLEEGGAIGRRLDFLCQEFNREANTVCSKAADIALTRIGLELKAAVEQLREQVQNIE
jgi:uncharacterized protein (TIGR00255 family)